MADEVLLAAVGCGRLQGMLDIAARHPFVVFGAMEGKVFSDHFSRLGRYGTTALTVYFYETG